VLSSAGNSLVVRGLYDPQKSSGNFFITSRDLLALEKFAPFFALAPSLQALDLNGRLKPDLRMELMSGGNFNLEGSVTLSGLALRKDNLNLSALSGALNLQASRLEQNLSTENMSFNFNGSPLKLQTRCSLAQNTAKVENLNIEGFGGSAQLKGSYRLDSGALLADLNGSGMQVESLLAALNPGAAAKLTGRLQTVKAGLSASVKNGIKETLAGSAAFELVDGSLPGFNLGGTVLKAVNLPFLSGALFASVPPEFAGQLSAESTPIKNAIGSFQILSGNMHTKDLSVLSSLFSLEATGRIGLDSSLDLKASILFNPEFSRALAQRTQELKRVFDRQDRLVVPLGISGTPPKIMVVPDVTKLAQLGAENLAKEKAGQFLDKALGGKGAGKGLGGLLGF